MTVALLLALALGSAPLDFSEVRRLSLAGDHEAAQKAAAELRDSPAFAAADETDRAEALFAIGVAQYRAEAPEEALSAFLECRDLAGPGARRLDAMYDMGTVLLERAEAVRATIPEIAGAAGSPTSSPAGTPGAPGTPIPGPMLGPTPGSTPGSTPALPPGSAAAPAAAQQSGPDPLETARAAYLAARDALLDRLRTARPDADTRANLELAVRRLRELDEIEKQRQEQQQKQQQQQQKDQQQQDQQSPSDDSQSKSSDQDQQQQDQPPADQQGSQDQQPEDQQQSPDQQDQKDQQDEQDKQQPPPDEGQQDEGSDQESQASPPPEEKDQELMSAEEIQRLMDRLKEIEEQARAVQAMLRQRERVPVEKDW